MRHRAFGQGMVVRHGLLLFTGLGLLAACAGKGTGPEAPLAYRITEGACGDVVFAESIGIDSASAFAVVEARKVEYYGEGEVTLEAHRLEVVDEHGNVPEPGFYAIFVLDAETGIPVHSVSEVITTEGDLFHLAWCPD